MNKPLFSIITVTYNASRFLEQTILSIISQSYRNIEFIVIDGNSSDGTQDIVRKYEAHIAYWISEPDKGLYDAMNKGMQKATGDYLWFVNAGDEIQALDTISNLVKKLQGPLPDIIYGETEIVDFDGNSLGMRRLKVPEKLNWKSFRMGMLICHQSFIVRREIAPPYDLSYRYSSDIDWCIRCMKKAEFLFNSRLSLSKFMEGGMSTESRKASLKERYLIMCKYYGKFPTQLRHIWFAFRFYSAKFLKGRV